MSNPIRCEEYPDSRSATSNPQTRTLHYWLSGIGDDSTARAYANGSTPLLFDGFYRQGMQIDPKGAGLWDLVVEYGAKDPGSDIGSVSVSFDTTGSTLVHVTQAIEHIASYAATGTAPDHSGAINVGENGPEGVDVEVPLFTWTESWTLPIAYASFYSAMVLKYCSKKVNLYPFRGLAAGTVKFDGGTISASTSDVTQATGVYKFTQSDETSNAMPSFKSGIYKGGWHYIWAEHEKQEDDTANRIVQPVIAAHVERVYEAVDFSLLGLGTGALS